MTEKVVKAKQGEAQTPWRLPTASFHAAIQSGWRSYRLVPWLFNRAGRVEPVDMTPEAFGGMQLFPTRDFSVELGYGIDGLGKKWGASIAQGETAALIAKLGQQHDAELGSGPITHQVYDTLGHVSGGGDSVAMLAPSRARLLRELNLDRAAVPEWLPGAGARSLLRGTFEGILVFATQPADATDLWIIDFTRVGWWQYAGQFDELATHARLRRDLLVSAHGTRDIATQITAEEFFAIVLDDNRAARRLHVPVASDL